MRLRTKIFYMAAGMCGMLALMYALTGSLMCLVMGFFAGYDFSIAEKYANEDLNAQHHD